MAEVVSCENAQIMPHVPENQSFQTSLPQMTTRNAYIPRPRQSRCMPELRRLEEMEKRLAQQFGMVSPQGTDSVAVLQEARRRENLPWERLRTTVIRKAGILASRRDAVDELEKLQRIRSNLQRLGYIRGSVSESLTSASPRYGARCWAVLIGIDAYESHPLQGCVSDALSIRKYLIEKLDVPENRIQSLLGSQNPIRGDSLTPSRANIVNVLYSLIENTEIARGDNIIVYYAGHGSSYHCSEHFFTPGSKCRPGACPIEALCPIDRDTKDTSGKWIPDISNRELNAVFSEISRTKGHKITVIADCCYASGISRDPDPEPGQRSMRGTCRSTADDMLHAADGRLKGFPCYNSVLSKNWLPDMGSHVVLAACRDHQIAKEGSGCGGVFTRRLVHILTSSECNKETTYVSLTMLLNDEPFQTPVIAGDHVGERLWYQTAAYCT